MNVKRISDNNFERKKELINGSSDSEVCYVLYSEEYVSSRILDNYLSPSHHYLV